MPKSGLDLFIGFLTEFGVISPESYELKGIPHTFEGIRGTSIRSHKLNLSKSKSFYIAELGFKGNADFDGIFNKIIKKCSLYDVLRYIKLFDFVEIKNSMKDTNILPSIFISPSNSNLTIYINYDSGDIQNPDESTNLKRNLLRSVILYIVKSKPDLHKYKNYIFSKSCDDSLRTIFDAMQPIIELVDRKEVNSMTINQFSEECLKTWKSSEQVEKLRRERIVELLEPVHAAMGISTEANEILDIYKKSIMYNRPINKNHLTEELGDLFFYGCMLAHENDIPLEHIFETNINKLRKRYKSSFTFEEANNKNHDKEMEAFKS